MITRKFTYEQLMEHNLKLTQLNDEKTNVILTLRTEVNELRAKLVKQHDDHAAVIRERDDLRKKIGKVKRAFD